MNKYLFPLFYCFVCLTSTAQVHIHTGGNLNVHGSLNLSTSNVWGVDASSNVSVFSPGGTIAGYNATTGNDVHINGLVRHIPVAANESFTFPVGDGTDLRTLSISGTRPVASFAVRYSTTTPNTGSSFLGGGINSVYQSAVWAADYTVSYSGATVTVSIPDLSTYASFGSDLRLVGYNPSTSKWENISGTTGASGLTQNSTLSGTITTSTLYTYFAVGSTNFALPLKLKRFDGSVSTNCTNSFRWQTSDENNVSGFELQVSDNSVNFKPAASVTAVGTGSNSYEANHLNSTASAGYYRLKIINKNGSFSFSDVIRLKNNCTATEQQLYPNPVTAAEKIFISFTAAARSRATIFVRSLDGKVMQQKVIDITAGKNNVTYSIQSLPRGVYSVQVVNSTGEIVFKTQKIINQ